MGVPSSFALFALASSCNLAVGLGDLQGGCPPKRGATQVKVTSATSPFCIDTTEVTNAQYLPFTNSGFKLTKTPDGCEALTSPTPSNDWPPATGYEDYPVTYVNWCQAYSFCAWAGKRLCGSTRHGPLAFASFTDASLSQWLNACSMGGARAYPYGNTFKQSACGGGGQAAGSSLEIVDKNPSCVGAFPGVYDMSGNVWEWIDSCGQPLPTADKAFCSTMGGAFDSTDADLACVGQRNWTRKDGAADIGFRCCLDL